MAETHTVTEAAARIEPSDTLGIPLGPGQPPGFVAALGERDDWIDLRIHGALLLAWSDAYKHPNVHYLSGFFGPVERALRDQGANIGFVPAGFRAFAPLLAQRAPRVMATAAAPPDEDGWCSLSLHAGGTADEPPPIPIACWSSRSRATFPGPGGSGPITATRSTSIGSTCSASPTRARSSFPFRSWARPTRRSPPSRTASSPTERPCRLASARFPRRSWAGSPTVRAATTGSTRRCSPTASWRSTTRAR